jgi:hypothetical protein
MVKQQQLKLFQVAENNLSGLFIARMWNLDIYIRRAT